MALPSTPATRSELQFGFDQMVKSLAAADIEVKLPAISPKPNRAEFVRMLGTVSDRIIQEAQFFPPPPPTFWPTNTAGLSEAEKGTLSRMVRWHLVDANSPLLSNPELPSPQDLGRILGVFLTQAADLTHPVSSKFSPSQSKG